MEDGKGALRLEERDWIKLGRILVGGIDRYQIAILLQCQFEEFRIL